MKKLLLYALLAFSAASCSKSKDKDPAPAATAAFAASRHVVEVNEEIRFTNTSTGATRYEWAFGDGQTSTLSAPTVKYPAVGTYTVTLKSYNSDNQAATQTFQVVVGKRNMTQLSLQSIAIFQPSGLPWDADGSGPDVNMFFDILAGTQVLQAQLGLYSNVTPARLPLVYNLGRTPVDELPNSTMNFRIVEDNPSSQRVMLAGNLSLAAPSADRDSEGAGTYTYQTTDGTWRFVVSYITIP